MQIGENLHGFTVTRIRPVAELEATMVEMTHDKTGAQLIWLDNGEENKVFSITFKTIPEDDTGVFHILEHTVLNGSDKYPVREPFVELLKSSLNTFLNAMTFQDKTMYPVSSRNKADFMNLISVYLDAVFHPLIDRKENMFMQEGWHIELPSRDAQPLYKGVVFNEMKGALSSVDEVVETGLNAMLYPDSPYRFVSGGDPAHIPELTYEQYVDTYRRFYHPSGSRIWLDGAVPLDEVLALIDGEYLSHFDALEEEHLIPVQAVLPACEKTCFSELAPSESPEHKTQLVFGRVACSWEDKDTVLAATVLCDVLAGSPEAPLTRAVLEAGLGQDVTMRINENIYQPNMMLRIHNTDDDKTDAVRTLVREVIAAQVKGGIDRSALEASINRLEFRYREPHEPAGLIRNINATSTWLYGGDPLDYLVWDDAFATLRARMDTDYFEELLALLMDEKYLCLLHVLPSATLGEERAAAEAARLKATMDAMDDAQLDALVAKNKMLTDWQQAPDSPEALATLPVLSLSEVGPEPLRTPTEVTTVDGVTVLTHKLNCKGVVHVNAYFALTDGDLKERSLLSALLGKLPTAKHTATELAQATKSVLGNVSFSVYTAAKPNVTDVCTPYLAARCSVLESKLDEGLTLLTEILTTTRFDDEARVRELLLQLDERCRQQAVTGGHMMALLQAGSHASAALAAGNLTGGYARAAWLHTVTQDFDAKLPAVIKALERCRDESVCRSRLLLGVTAAEEVPLSGFICSLPVGTPAPETMVISSDAPKKSAVVIPAPICFAAMTAPLAALGASANGSLEVLSNIATYDYLWNEVRVKGGAYGTGLRAMSDTMLAAYSFRDPSAVNSLAAYRGLGDFVRSFCAGGADLTRNIIASIGATEPLSSPRDQGISADMDWMNGNTWERRCARRREILATTPADLLAWANALDAMAKDGAICIFGGAAQVDACKDEALTVATL